MLYVCFGALAAVVGFVAVGLSWMLFEINRLPPLDYRDEYGVGWRQNSHGLRPDGAG
jgi:hypothetical protein